MRIVFLAAIVGLAGGCELYDDEPEASELALTLLGGSENIASVFVTAFDGAQCGVDNRANGGHALAVLDHELVSRGATLERRLPVGRLTFEALGATGISQDTVIAAGCMNATVRLNEVVEVTITLELD